MRGYWEPGAIPDPFAALERRLRLAVIGGGPDSVNRAIHRAAAQLDDWFENDLRGMTPRTIARCNRTRGPCYQMDADLCAELAVTLGGLNNLRASTTFGPLRA